MFKKFKSLAVNNRKGQGTLTIAIIASTLFATIVASATSWYLSMNNKVDGFDDKLESMSIAMSEWQRLEHMSLEELEAHRDEYKDPWDVGSKYKVSVTLGEQGTFEDGQCKTTTSSGSSDEKNCFKDTIMTVYDSNDIPLYTTRTLPLSSQSSGESGEAIGTIVPRLNDNFKNTAEVKKYLLCDGSTFDTSKYPKLYAILGTNQLPDLRNRFLQGAVTVEQSNQKIEAGLPNIKGQIVALRRGGEGVNESFTNGAFREYSRFNSRIHMGNSDDWGSYFTFDASRSNTIYGRSQTVQPPAVTVRYYIRAK